MIITSSYPNVATKRHHHHTRIDDIHIVILTSPQNVITTNTHQNIITTHQRHRHVTATMPCAHHDYSEF
jgi:hypothetical protein